MVRLLLKSVTLVSAGGLVAGRLVVTTLLRVIRLVVIWLRVAITIATAVIGHFALFAEAVN